MSAADFRRTLSREDGFDRRQRWLRRLHLDLPLLVLVLLTAAYGLVVLYSALDGDWAALMVAAGGRPIEGLLGCSIFSCFVLFSKKRMMAGLGGSPY